ncbi:Protein of unknown function [Lactobacillus hominis DSM 23910 = CRBIP 24.179]|uniref:Uncharacterized protein n=1 Tax=Lactobacillus hominis DSM 23910 = CRBIP 24.179 TaxID=1423758 RepID=I7L9J5_9LACO|nr:Protein of unknown function [Lactobacillus hominis DSM 23910 = CRBIP 24.179]
MFLLHLSKSCRITSVARLKAVSDIEAVLVRVFVLISSWFLKA